VVFGGSAVWDLATGAAIALTLWAIAVAVFAMAKSWRLRMDHRVIEAAERFEPVDLTSVVKRYVPARQQTQKAAEEIAIARQVIDARRPRWRRAGIISGVVILCGASVAAFSIRQDLKTASTLPAAAAKPVVNLDALKDIQGVWGWRADYQQSCEENPQTISVASDGKKVSVSYAKPYHHGSRVTTSLDFDVVTTKPDELVLTKSDAPPTQASPTLVHFRFIDENAFAISWSNDAAGSSGTVARCR